MVEELFPWCRPCEQFHQETSCYVANQVMEHGLPEVSSQETTLSDPDHVYMVGHAYPLSNQHWKQTTDYSYEKDLLSNFYGEMPTLEIIQEMKEARFKGLVYRKKEKSSPAK